MQQTKDLIVEVKEAKAPADTATAVWCSLLLGGRWSLVVFFGGRRGDRIDSLGRDLSHVVRAWGGGPLTAGALWAPRPTSSTLFDFILLYSILMNLMNSLFIQNCITN